MRLLHRTSIAAGVLIAGIAAGAEAASAAPSARVSANGTLVLTGTAARDDITLRVRSAEPDQLEIDLGNDGSADLQFDRGEFNRIRVRARGGNDRVRIDDSEVAFTTFVPTVLEGEKGKDRLTGGAGDEELVGARGADVVVGKGGDDIVALGNGRDRFRWAPGDGNDSVTGGQARDELTFRGDTGDEDLSVLADGTRARLLRSVDNVDLVLDRVERISLLARRGSDTITVGDLAGTGVRRVTADAGAADAALDLVAVTGTPGADTITATAAASIRGLTATVALAGVEPTDQLALDAGDGADSVSTVDLPLNTIALRTDGGFGTDTILGGRSAERLLGGGDADTVDGNGGDDIVRLGGADDTLVWDPGDGSDVVDGQGGDDTMRFNGSSAAEQLAAARAGSRVLFTRDVGNITMDLVGIEEIDAVPAGGPDTVTADNVAGTGLDDLVAELGTDGAADRVVVRASGGNDLITPTGSAGSALVTGLQSGLAVGVRGAQAPQDALVLNTLGGDDRVRAEGLAADAVALTVDGGDDDDTLLGGAGPDRLLAGDGFDIVDGNRGDDIALLGAQDDEFVWDPGDGSDIVEGEADRDTLRFNGSSAAERFAVAPNGQRVRFTRDIGNITMDLGGVERIDTATLDGADVVTVDDTSGTSLTDVRADVADDDGERDKVNVNATEGDDVIVVGGSAGFANVSGGAPRVLVANADPADDELELHMLGGDDVVDASALDAGVIALQAQGGPNDDVLIGSDGPDTLFGGDNDDILIGGPGIDTLDGGPGTNTVVQD